MTKSIKYRQCNLLISVSLQQNKELEGQGEPLRGIASDFIPNKTSKAEEYARLLRWKIHH